MIGYIGDKFGSSIALQISIVLMAFPTFALGCLPSYEKVGYWSTALLILIRVLQGLSVGGQITSSLVFTVERHPKSEWGFYGSFVFMAAHVGGLLGSLTSYILRSTLSESQLKSWGWRIPFFFGLVVVIFAVYLRRHCSDEHNTAGSGGASEQNPICAAFAQGNRRSLLGATLVPMLSAISFYITFVWMPIFMTDIISPPVPQAFAVNSISLFLSVILCFPPGGLASDYFGRVLTMTFGCILLIISGPLLVRVIGQGNAVKALLSQTALGAMYAFWGGPMGAWLAESFPPEVRLTSISIGYNLGLSLCGGFSPALATVMVEKLGVNSPGYLYTIFGFLSLMGLCIVRKRDVEPVCSDDSREEEQQLTWYSDD